MARQLHKLSNGKRHCIGNGAMGHGGP